MKTLKNIEEEYNFISRRKVKQEAIKWVKFYRRKKLWAEGNAIQLFHNITEEDLEKQKR